MKYRDLVQFDPIDTIIQLRQADAHDKARDLVRSYVISERMADRLASVIIPQLDLDRPLDAKGVLIIGNYGTGKSHLMSVLAGVAEHGDLVSDLTNTEVADAAKAIAGRYHVARVEIGAVRRSLRDILLDELASALARWGTPYDFPAAEEVGNNKDAVIAAVAQFRQRYPDQGVLLVVDELLDYLGSRNEMELILDLGFLRELGEVSALTPFRFIGGLQEMLFDNPRFRFVSNQLNRVRDRFEQVLIARDDIAFVIANRLLKKTDTQIAWIRDHLRPFEPLYEGLTERMAEFASLFPIHPAYIETFEAMFIAEKRQVLQTFSRAMAERLEDEVPSDRPGVISFDHYWQVLRDAQLRTVPQVARVLDKGGVLENLVRQGYTRPALLDLALRIVHGLAVHRLTTDDIEAPVGLTAQALRDRLFLYQQIPERDAQFLEGQIKVALQAIMTTAHGQYLAMNADNGQYYMTLGEGPDVDFLVRERAATLSADTLNRYFRDAMSQVLGLSSGTYVVDRPIWFYELPWSERRVTRPGYLFMGLPCERTTAQPPRDFYVYLLPPFQPGEFNDEELEDEVLFSIEGAGQAFEDLVRRYAAARDLSLSSVQQRTAFASIAEQALRQLVVWLHDNLVPHLRVTHEGAKRPAQQVLGELRATASENTQELFSLIAAHLLGPCFVERYPGYPTFAAATANITEQAREATALQAVRGIAGLRRTALANAVLDGLGLLGAGDALRPYDSPYARHLLALLQAKPEGQVVNRSEVIQTVAGGVDRPVEKDLRFALEPEWVAVVLAALVHSGDIEISLAGQRINAGSLDRLATLNMSDLGHWRHYGATPSVPLGLWGEVFATLGLAPGLIRDENTREEAVRSLQTSVKQGLERVASMEHRLNQGLRLWNESLFTDVLVTTDRGEVTGAAPQVAWSKLDVLPHVRAVKKLLDALQPFNTVGKLRNLRVSMDDIADARGGLEVMARVDRLLALLGELQDATSYLAAATPYLPAGDGLRAELAAAREDLLIELRRMGKGDQPPAPGRWPAQLADLKQLYVSGYAAAHRRLRLNSEDDARVEGLQRSPELRQVLELDQLHLLPSTQLEGWKARVTGLVACPSFHEGLLDGGPDCPYCHLNPATERGGDAHRVLLQLEEDLAELLAGWRRAVIEALNSADAQRNLRAATPDECATIKAFLDHPEAPTLPEGFVPIANRILKGFELLSLTIAEIAAALQAGGLPCTVDELQARFNGLVLKKLTGHDRGRTRVTVEE